MQNVKLTLLTAASLLMATVGSAALVAADDFESYGTGSLSGGNGGTGWQNTWTSNSTTVVDGGLSYSNGSVNVNGGSRSISVTSTSNNNILRQFDGAGTGNEVYFSFLFQMASGEGPEFFNVSLNSIEQTGTDANKNSPGQIGDLDTGSFDFGARMARNGGDSSGISYGTGQTHLLVGRISNAGTSDATGANYDLVELWVDPDSSFLGTPDAFVDSNTTGTAVGSLQYINMRTANVGSGDDLRYDEFRIGTSADSVVIPEPSTMALFAGSLLVFGLTAVRRRRS